ncbi:MAG: iron-containing alcohol dehydrogenase [Deltaproteobacteria bacterium]|nr:iron-containing alcohol dehydrogenase [Deltaproteobacteria bacterium]
MSYDVDLNFIFRLPTKILFGPGTAKEVGMEVDELKGTKALIVTDRDLVKTDLVNFVRNALGTRCVGIFSDVTPDTGVHIINAGSEYGRSLGADILVSVGGGSAIDTAKGMAICLTKGGKLEDHAGLNMLGSPLIPHIVIPTTAGTGSEVTYAAVIKDHEQKRKLLFADNFLIPNIAILDPSMTTGMPKSLTAATGMDALCHCIEAIPSMQREPITDGLAFHGIRLIREFLPRAVQNGEDIVARGQMLIAATLGGAAFSNAQLGLVHALAHCVGAAFGVPHGVANSILLPHCILYNLDACPDLYARIAEAMGKEVRGMDPLKAAEQAAIAIWEFTRALGLPQTLREVNVEEAGLVQCANEALMDGTIVYNPKPVFDPDEVLKIYQNAF